MEKKPSSDDSNVGADTPAFDVVSPIASVLEYWKEFDLENSRSRLDEQGLKIAENQELSAKNRKQLAELTREFRRSTAPDKAGLFPPLLKAFQEEVDRLTKRAKFAEGAFLGLYQGLYEAPDPTPGLMAAHSLTERVSELESSLRVSTSELEEYRAESAHLKNQQATVRRLEERNKQLELQMEEKVKEMVLMKQQVMAEESQKSLEVLKEREEELHSQLRAAKESVQNMSRLHEIGQNQLFELKAKSDEEVAEKHSEMSLLTDEMDRAAARLMSLEREKESLKAQLTAAQAGQTPDDTSVERLEATLGAKERLISELHSELRQAESSLVKMREENASQVNKLNQEITQKEETIAQLQSEIARRPTVKQLEDLKKQVQMLQAVGYNSVESEEWDEPSEGSADASKASESARGLNSSGAIALGRLESLLLEKNRKLEHEVTQHKVQLAEKSKERDELVVRVKGLEAENSEQKKLILRLEEDIVKNSSDKAGRSDDWDSAPDSSMTTLLTSNGGQPKSAKSTAGDGAGDGEHSMLALVCGQRDRFRHKMGELEEELRAVRGASQSLRVELERSKADNVKLYERIRYVSEYTSKGTQRKGYKDDVEAGGADVEAKYRKLYEENINPFADFSKKEREQRYKDLGFRDQITLKSGRFFLGNKYARTFIFFYSIALHLLVFLSVYQLLSFSQYSVTATYESSDLVSKKGALAALKAMAMNSTNHFVNGTKGALNM